MGKTKKSKPKVTTVNPIGIPSVRQFNEELLAAEDHPHGPIAAMVDQLQSTGVVEKMCALQSLSFLCQNRQRIPEIIQSDIVKTIASWLIDPCENIKNATAGALRNLSMNGIEVCENLVEQDVLTPLLALLNKYAMLDWKPHFDDTVNNQIDQEADTFLQAINLVWNLCESTGIALSNFNQTRIVQSFIRYLDYHVFGLDISIAVAQCLVVITEDNSVAWPILNDYTAKLLLLLKIPEQGHAYTLLRTLSAAICANIPNILAQNLNDIFETLSKTLNVNHRKILADVSSRTLPLNVNRNELFITEDSNAMEDETDQQASVRRRKQDMPSPVELEVRNVGWLLEAQRLGGETITNICTVEDEEKTDDVQSNSSDAESVHDYDMASSHSSTNLQNTDKLPSDVLEAVKSLGLVETIWQRAQPIAENVNEILREAEQSLLNKVERMQISSLISLHNLCNLMTTEDLGGPAAIYKVWLDLGQQFFQGTQNADVLEASTSLTRAALEHLKCSPDLFNKMTDSDLNLMLNSIQVCTESETRANWLRMLGVLGCFLPEVLVRIIVTFIVETSLQEQDAWALSEAMDALMDIFSDNNWDQMVHELGLVAKAKQLERVFKNKIYQQKRDLGERYGAACAVRLNLTRFSDYMKSQQRKYKPK